MPGHKGSEILGFEGVDITEIFGADTLYSENGILKESQENASQEFLTLNPKVTFKILTHPICITQERHLHRTYL